MSATDHQQSERQRRPNPTDRFLLAGAVLAVIALTVPVAPGVWSGARSLFGLPGSFVWVIGVLLFVFGLLLWSFATDPNRTVDANRDRETS